MPARTEMLHMGSRRSLCMVRMPPPHLTRYGSAELLASSSGYGTGWATITKLSEYMAVPTPVPQYLLVPHSMASTAAPGAGPVQRAGLLTYWYHCIAGRQGCKLWLWSSRSGVQCLQQCQPGLWRIWWLWIWPAWAGLWPEWAKSVWQLWQARLSLMSAPYSEVSCSSESWPCWLPA